MNLEEIKRLIDLKERYPVHRIFFNGVLLGRYLPELIAEVESLKERLKIEEELFENSNEALGYAQEENVRLREALAFYANKENYEWDDIDGVHCLPSDVLSDEGKTARQALGSE